METRSREIGGMDVRQLFRLLNQAYASKWLSYYQYWLGAKVIKDPMKAAMAAELTRHAMQELNHAMLLANRIIQLGGIPVISPRGWSEVSLCKYEAPEDPYIASLLDQNIVTEQWAITTYKNLMDMTKDKDTVTYDLALKILEQEVEQEEDMQGLREDLDLVAERGSK